MQNAYPFLQSDFPRTKATITPKTKWLDPTTAIYTNRDLRLKDISVVGFDMDYTLAKYIRKPMEQLQYDLTVEYLIKEKNYPTSIQKLKYDPTLINRGLVVDKRHGVLLKLDTHDHVWRAIYGRKMLSSREINKRYANEKISLSFEHFSSLDTLFAMPEAGLYCNLIEFFEERSKKKKPVTPVKPKAKGCNPRINTRKLFDDVRNSMDSIHADGSLKAIITQNLPLYISNDPDIALTLHKLRSVGKKVFLLTNSYWHYTNLVMSYILESKLPEYNTWRSYFDIIITGACKPSFFISKKPFLKLNSSKATRGKVEEDFVEISADKFISGEVYQSGNRFDFERMAKCRGEDILYVGDHIYGDIVLSKKESLWRTCLIVEELQQEIELSSKYAKLLSKAAKLEAESLQLDTDIGHKRVQFAHIEAAIEEMRRASHKNFSVKKLDALAKIIRKEIEASKRKLHELDKNNFIFQDELEAKFHKKWGRLFREHNQLSRFGAQITHYACIYTSDLTNLLQYSPLHVFRAPGDLMSHDIALVNQMQLPKANKKKKK